jgi:hypothetical protein
VRNIHILFGVLSCAVGSSVVASDEAHTYGKFGLGTAWTGYQVVLAVHQLPLTTTHEGTHFLVAAAFGGKPKLHLLPSYVDMEDTHERVLAMGYTEATEDLSTTRLGIVAIAPWVVQVAVVNPLIEMAYRHNAIRRDTFGDKYILATLQFDLASPLANTIPRSGDFSRFAAAIHVHRFIIGAVVQGVYYWSYTRIVKARGNPRAGWVWYFRAHL